MSRRKNEVKRKDQTWEIDKGKYEKVWQITRFPSYAFSKMASAKFFFSPGNDSGSRHRQAFRISLFISLISPCNSLQQLRRTFLRLDDKFMRRSRLPVFGADRTFRGKWIKHFLGRRISSPGEKSRVWNGVNWRSNRFPLAWEFVADPEERKKKHSIFYERWQRCGGANGANLEKLIYNGIKW